MKPIKANFPVIRETDNQQDKAFMKASGCTDVRTYRAGKNRIILSQHPVWGWGLVIVGSDRLPTWEEVEHVRYKLVPDNVLMVMILPPISDRVAMQTGFLLQEAYTSDYSAAQIKATKDYLRSMGVEIAGWGKR